VKIYRLVIENLKATKYQINFKKIHMNDEKGHQQPIANFNLFAKHPGFLVPTQSSVMIRFNYSRFTKTFSLTITCLDIKVTSSRNSQNVQTHAGFSLLYTA